MDVPEQQPERTPLNRGRRDKVQLSCNLCRKRKLKCDRQRPCGTCSSRGLSLSCTYPAPKSVHPTAATTASQHSVLGRIVQLENLLVSLVGSTRTEAGTESRRATRSRNELSNSCKRNSPSETDSPSDSGSLRVDAAGTTYVGSAHWTAIMDGLSELKDCFQDEDNGVVPNMSDHNPGLSQSTPPDGPQLLFGCHTSISRDDVLRAMPERLVVDRLVFQYFNHVTLLGPHKRSFLRQYEKFWADPSSVPLTWLALLYAIMGLTVQYNLGISSTRLQRPSQPLFVEQIVQCLILGNYSRGGPYTINALAHYLAIEQVSRPDSEVGNWLLMGLIIRLALRMGYHRDSSQFPEITPFEGEMRRRMWLTLYCMDVMLSIQMGVPRLIQDGTWDTKPPRNLLDTDFDEDCLELPTPRPDNEMTSIITALGKHKMIRVLGQIADMSMTLGANENSEIVNMDRLLRSTYDSLPETLKFTSLSKCLGSSPQDIIESLCIAILLQKGLIFLHWQYFMSNNAPHPQNAEKATENESKTDNAMTYSLQSSVDAALKTLEYQHLLHWETQPGGTLGPMKWRFSSILSHEFLTATTVLCFYLYQKSTARSSVVSSIEEGKVQEIKAALMRAHQIWITESAQSQEARKAANMLDMLFKKLEGSHTVPPCNALELSNLAMAQRPGQMPGFAADDAMQFYFQVPGGSYIGGQPSLASSGQSSDLVGRHRLSSEIPTQGTILSPTSWLREY